MNIAVFASHGGSDLQAIIDGCNNHAIDAKVVVVISNNSDSMALQRAAKENIPMRTSGTIAWKDGGKLTGL